MPGKGDVADAGGTARDAFLGYTYQAEVALLELTRRRIASADPEWSLTIEVVDDVAFERDASPEEFFQTKHSRNAEKDLGDHSVDLWKTIRNWSELVAKGFDPRHVTFTLWTTAAAREGSAVALLRAEGRVPESAHEQLVLVARTSESQQNRKGYEAFLALGDDTRRALVASILVADGSAAIDTIDEELRRLVWAGADPSRQDAFVRRLREWWYGRVRAHLLGQDNGRVESVELDAALKDVREQLIGDALPLDVPRSDPRLDQLDTADRLFVSQLQLIAIGNEAFDLAVRDYKRAYLQRSLWLKDELLPAADLARYEDTLIDEWEHHRADAHASVSNADEVLQEAGRDLYRRIQRVQIAIHDSRKEGFICRGSYHMLADELRVGWHPEFVARLREVLA
jgi:hypothetical protein